MLLMRWPEGGQQLLLPNLCTYEQQHVFFVRMFVHNIFHNIKLIDLEIS